ncbi:MAG: hypothetical protein H6R19_3483 [Proteobacteria bacterium]|nr:hypothetical protein [Pseudomonadota bacterium]
MNEQPNTTPSTAPVRPDLFAAHTSGKGAPQRISVLASLGQAQQHTKRTRRWPLFLGLLLGLSCMAMLGFYFASRPTPKAIPTPSAVRQTPPPPLASAPQVTLPIEASAPTAPASIETLSPETSLVTPTRTTPEVSDSSPIAPPPTPEPSAAHGKRSLLKALSAPAADTSKPAKDKGKGKSVAARSNRKNQQTSDTDNVDTDVILLEALLSHTKTKSPGSEGATSSKKAMP